MDRPKKKSATDYPQFIFRVGKDEKERLSSLVDEVQSLYDRNRKDDEKATPKSRIIIKALEMGLEILRKKKPNLWA